MCAPRTTLTVLIIFAVSFTAAGQTWLGSFHSPKGIGLSGMRASRQGGPILKTDIYADLAGVLRGWNPHPGIQARVSSLQVLGGHTLSTGTCLQLLAGAGVMVGYVSDYEDDTGPAVALTGEVGLVLNYRKQVTIGIGFSADFGQHLQKEGISHTLSLYQDGLRRSYYPELRILYRFHP